MRDALWKVARLTVRIGGSGLVHVPTTSCAANLGSTAVTLVLHATKDGICAWERIA